MEQRANWKDFKAILDKYGIKNYIILLIGITYPPLSTMVGYILGMIAKTVTFISANQVEIVYLEV